MVDRSCPSPPDSTAGGARHPRVLLVAGHDIDAIGIANAARGVTQHGLDLVPVKRLVEAIALLGSRAFDCVLLALGDELESALAAFAQLAQHTSDRPVVIVTTRAGEASARAAVSAGATDYFLAGTMNVAKLRWSIENALVGRDLQELARDMRHELREAARRLCERCKEVRRRNQAGAELDTFALPWATDASHNVVCTDCAPVLTRRSA